MKKFTSTIGWTKGMAFSALALLISMPFSTISSASTERQAPPITAAPGEVGQPSCLCIQRRECCKPQDGKPKADRPLKLTL
ncbi:MAG: hypothetical protein Q8R24_09280 [Legionellaceae bacterium]|nr:hypothetical protein [Legionellaceae bacterium]